MARFQVLGMGMGMGRAVLVPFPVKKFRVHGLLLIQRPLGPRCGGYSSADVVISVL